MENETPDSFIDSDIQNSSSETVLSRLQNNTLCDVEIYGKLPDKETNSPINGHKIILAAASPYFHEAFKSENFIDSGGKTYTIKQIDHASLKVALDYIYSGKLNIGGDDNIQTERVRNVLIAADYLLMTPLVHLCGVWLTKALDYLSGTSSFPIWLFAQKYHCKVLEQAALDCAVQSLDIVATNADFLNLKVGKVVEFIKLSTFKSAVPDLICKAATNWLGFEQEMRKTHFDLVLRKVPLKSMSVEGLQAAIENESIPRSWLLKLQQLKLLRTEVTELESKKASMAREQQWLQAARQERTDLINEMQSELSSQVYRTHRVDEIIHDYRYPTARTQYRGLFARSHICAVERMVERHDARNLLNMIESVNVFDDKLAQKHDEMEIKACTIDDADYDDDLKDVVVQINGIKTDLTLVQSNLRALRAGCVARRKVIIKLRLALRQRLVVSKRKEKLLAKVRRKGIIPGADYQPHEQKFDWIMQHQRIYNVLRRELLTDKCACVIDLGVACDCL